MPKPNQESLEATLLRNLTAAKGGDEEALDRVCDALLQVREQHTSLVPVLRSILATGEPTLMTYGANALGNLKEGARPAVPDLAELARSGSGASREAAVCALGSIPGKESVECLVEIFEAGDPRLAKTWAAPALKRHGAEVAPYLARLEVAASLYVGDDWEIVNMALNEIRRSTSRDATGDLSSVDLGTRIPIYPKAWGGQAADDYYAAYAQELPAGKGLVYDERFPFVAGPKSEVGIQIYRTNRSDPEVVVVFSEDDRAYGQSVTNAFMYLATAVTHIFDLDPKRTAWVERIEASSGYARSGHDEVDLVRMSYEPKTATFHGPQWERKESLEMILEEFGAVG